ncbi:hypothetical protein WK57_17080 [Burkholderia ubonensis]|uniref:Integrase n=1 Tax=Burkholderia ubonensis TaxID=101571 RepID=A0AA40UXS0_9BURK|nr:hypothetical protein [Burkholderia ubonensis]KWZ58784.1 hypothetical protein WK57_17080 [Burkholderia ubonensis]
MRDIDPMALFRLSVLGPIVSRERLERGELLQLLRQLARQEYAIPGSRRRHISERTLQTWYYAWRRDGVKGLASQPRVRIPRKPNAHSTLKRTPIPRLSEHAFHAQANAADVATRA